jgi:hypothetical protein
MAIDRTGYSPVARPTEWTTAVVLLITAAIAWYNDRNTAALVAAIGAALPVIVTALATWYDRRHGGAFVAPAAPDMAPTPAEPGE